MNLLETCLLFYSVVSALTVSGVSSQSLEISVEPAKPSLSGPILINCTADVLSKKIESLSIFRGKEEILTFNPSKRPRINWPDDSLKSRFTFYKTLKKQTILSLELKTPRCTDQNVYKCGLTIKNKTPQNAEKRIDFYVQKQGVEMTENKATNCLHVDITCVGHAGNPPEHMGWFKKTPDDNEFTRIDSSYITTNMDFHTENCSNTRRERLVFKPTEEEQDLIIKCGFGDMAKEVTMRMPGQAPEDVTLMFKGTPEVGKTLELNCTGKLVSSTDYSVNIYKKTELNMNFVKLMIGVIQEDLVKQDDCMFMAIKVMSYKLSQEDKGLQLMCRVTESEKTTDAMQMIDVKGLFVVPTGIPVGKPDHTPDDDNDKDGNDMDDKDNEMEKKDENMDDNISMEVTGAPEPDPEGNDEKEGDNKDEKMAEKEAEEEKEKVKPKIAASEGKSSGMLRGYCLLVIASALLVMA